jgi:hypothetical protein
MFTFSRTTESMVSSRVYYSLASWVNKLPHLTLFPNYSVEASRGFRAPPSYEQSAHLCNRCRQGDKADSRTAGVTVVAEGQGRTCGRQPCVVPSQTSYLVQVLHHKQSEYPPASPCTLRRLLPLTQIYSHFHLDLLLVFCSDYS